VSNLSTFCDVSSQNVLSAATKYIESLTSPIDDTDFNRQCGVGELF
jgi:hypothetical protein